MGFKRNGPVILPGLTVEVRGNFERALRTFNKKVQTSGILKDLREKEYYEKPTTRRKKARQIAIKRERCREEDIREVEWD